MEFWIFKNGDGRLISQAVGKGDYRELVNILIRNLFIALLISFLIILSKPFLLNILNQVFRVSDVTKSLIESYISIRIFSTPAELIIYILVGFYLGIQRTFISSFLIIIFSILNIIFSIYFVKQLNLDVKGVALGTLLSSYMTILFFSAFTYFYLIRKFKLIPRFNQKVIFNFKKIFRLLNINFNIFLRTIFLTFAFFWITYLSSTLGEEYVAINSILLQLVFISSFFLDSY